MALSALETKALREALRLLKELPQNAHDIAKAAKESVITEIMQHNGRMAAQANSKSVTEEQYTQIANNVSAACSRATVSLYSEAGKIEDWLKSLLGEK